MIHGRHGARATDTTRAINIRSCARALACDHRRGKGRMDGCGVSATFYERNYHIGVARDNHACDAPRRAKSQLIFQRLLTDR